MSESRIIKAGRMFSELDTSKSISDMTYEEVVHLKTNLKLILDLLDESSIFAEQKKKVANRMISWFNIKYPSWKINSKQKESIIPRQILQCLLYDKTDLTLKQIGQITGGYKHENVIYSSNVVNSMIENDDEEYCTIYKEAIKQINP